MGKIFYFCMKDLKKRVFFTLMLLLVCTFAVMLILSSTTNAFTLNYQNKILTDHLGYAPERVFHLHYKQSDETEEFADTLSDYREYLQGLDGVTAVFQFQETSEFFSELADNDEFISLSKQVFQGSNFSEYPANIAHILLADETALGLVKNEISGYVYPESDNMPVYASEVFSDALPVGTIITNERTNIRYEIVGYFSKGTSYVEKDDLIRFPMISLDGWFIMPFTDYDKSDILTQLSCLHNTYILLDDNADTEMIRNEICDYSVSHGFEANGNLLSEELDMYRQELDTLNKRQIAIDLFLVGMSVVSLVSFFATNALTNKRQYGILAANGFRKLDIIHGIGAEIFVITLISSVISWLMKYRDIQKDDDLFQQIWLAIHIRVNPIICLVLCAVITLLSVMIPAFIINKYQVSELIGGDTNAND